jgi:hypothetical protein
MTLKEYQDLMKKADLTIQKGAVGTWEGHLMKFRGWLSSDDYWKIAAHQHMQETGKKLLKARFLIDSKLPHNGGDIRAQYKHMKTHLIVYNELLSNLGLTVQAGILFNHVPKNDTPLSEKKLQDFLHVYEQSNGEEAAKSLKKKWIEAPLEKPGDCYMPLSREEDNINSLKEEKTKVDAMVRAAEKDVESIKALELQAKNKKDEYERRKRDVERQTKLIKTQKDVIEEMGERWKDLEEQIRKLEDQKAVLGKEIEVKEKEVGKDEELLATMTVDDGEDSSAAFEKVQRDLEEAKSKERASRARSTELSDELEKATSALNELVNQNKEDDEETSHKRKCPSAGKCMWCEWMSSWYMTVLFHLLCRGLMARWRPKQTGAQREATPPCPWRAWDIDAPNYLPNAPFARNWREYSIYAHMFVSVV